MSYFRPITQFFVGKHFAGNGIQNFAGEHNPGPTGEVLVLEQK